MKKFILLTSICGGLLFAGVKSASALKIDLTGTEMVMRDGDGKASKHAGYEEGTTFAQVRANLIRKFHIPEGQEIIFQYNGKKVDETEYPTGVRFPKGALFRVQVVQKAAQGPASPLGAKPPVLNFLPAPGKPTPPVIRVSPVTPVSAPKPAPRPAPPPSEQAPQIPVAPAVSVVPIVEPQNTKKTVLIEYNNGKQTKKFQFKARPNMTIAEIQTKAAEQWKLNSEDVELFEGRSACDGEMTAEDFGKSKIISLTLKVKPAPKPVAPPAPKPLAPPAPKPLAPPAPVEAPVAPKPPVALKQFKFMIAGKQVEIQLEVTATGADAKRKLAEILNIPFEKLELGTQRQSFLVGVPAGEYFRVYDSEELGRQLRYGQLIHVWDNGTVVDGCKAFISLGFVKHSFAKGLFFPAKYGSPARIEQVTCDRPVELEFPNTLNWERIKPKLVAHFFGRGENPRRYGIFRVCSNGKVDFDDEFKLTSDEEMFGDWNKEAKFIIALRPSGSVPVPVHEPEPLLSELLTSIKF